MYPTQVAEIVKLINDKTTKFGFLRGAGGTGKTYAIAKTIEYLGLNLSQYAFMGPTGKSVAVAEEKGLTGVTLHRFFKIQTNDSDIKIKRFIDYKFKGINNYYAEMKKQLIGIKLIFIDEISMINNQLMLHILETLVECLSPDGTIFLSGDYHQLSPVIKDKILKSSISVVEALIPHHVKIIDFNTRYRSDNEEFNRFLHNLRMGNIRKTKDVVDFLKKTTNVYKPEDYPYSEEHKFTFLTQTNRDVDEINEKLLHELEGELYEYTFKINKDEYPPGAKEIRNEIIDDFQMDNTVSFKIGSKVLFRTNHIDEQYKNGEEGIIEAVKPLSIMIRKLRTNTLIEVKKHLYTSTELEKKDGFNIEIEQWPFSLGNARTIHKAQGDGFEYLHLNFGFLSRYGYLTDEIRWQLFYVSISRIIDPSKVWISDVSIKMLECQFNLFKNINYKRYNLLSKDEIIPEYIERDI